MFDSVRQAMLWSHRVLGLGFSGLLLIAFFMLLESTDEPGLKPVTFNTLFCFTNGGASTTGTGAVTTPPPPPPDDCCGAAVVAETVPV